MSNYSGKNIVNKDENKSDFNLYGDDVGKSIFS